MQYHFYNLAGQPLAQIQADLLEEDSPEAAITWLFSGFEQRPPRDIMCCQGPVGDWDHWSVGPFDLFLEKLP